MSAIDNAAETGYDWFKSSYSGDNNSCVECANVPSIVPVRDSKRPNGPALVFQRESWTSFLTLVK
ncbi:DUF397 domain-containing protein [Streptomyces scabiei]|uniref:DUF397 domain-containing protein n=1 Tax=Streptomyces scabiei TaxID=1930 RepID=UPI0033F85045